MLVLARKVGEKIVINDTIIVSVVEMQPRQGCSTKVRLGIEAPRDVTVHRHEVWLRIQEEKNANHQ